MKIAYDSSRLAGPATGIHRYLEYLERPDLPRRHEWLPLAKPPGMRQFRWLFRELPRAAERGGADLLLAPHFWDYPGRTRKPIVAVVHDVWPLEQPLWADPHWWRHRLLHPLHRAAGVICDSEFTRERLQAIDPALKAPLSVLRIPPAVVFVPEAPELPLPGLNDELFYLAVVSDDERKNLPFLAALAERLPAPLVAVGPLPPERLPAARCLGVISDEVLASLYNRAIALLFPSLYEGYGLPPLEAAACRCPVMLAKTTSLPEMLGKEYPGLLSLDLDEWLTMAERLQNESSLRAFFLQAGMKRLEGFGTADCFRSLEDFLEECGER